MNRIIDGSVIIALLIEHSWNADKMFDDSAGRKIRNIILEAMTPYDLFMVSLV